jgi:hypothetical protein
MEIFDQSNCVRGCGVLVNGYVKRIHGGKPSNYIGRFHIVSAARFSAVMFNKHRGNVSVREQLTER